MRQDADLEQTRALRLSISIGAWCRPGRRQWCAYGAGHECRLMYRWAETRRRAAPDVPLTRGVPGARGHTTLPSLQRRRLS